MRRLVVLLALLVLAVPASAARLPILASRDWWPVFSPDSRSIAFTRVNGQGRVFTLEVVPAAGGRVVRLAQASSQLLPSWSPDSTRLAYQSGGRIYTVGRDGGDRRSVAAGLFPAWSPDGSSVAYVRDGALRVTSRVLATRVIWKPDWSPDGKELAFARADGIHAVTLGGVERRVAATAVEPSAPLWSPDGSSIAYTDDGAVYVVAADGSSAPRRVAGPFFFPGPLSWSPAGDALAYTVRGAVELTVLAPAPHTQTLVPGGGVGTSFAPGDPHGRVLAYAGPRAACPGHTAIRLYGGSTLSGSCLVSGTAAADVIEGTPSFGDRIVAGAGNDRIHANDGHTDRVDCGPGRDTVWADRTDRLTACEVIHR